MWDAETSKVMVQAEGTVALRTSMKYTVSPEKGWAKRKHWVRWRRQMAEALPCNVRDSG